MSLSAARRVHRALALLPFVLAILWPGCGPLPTGDPTRVEGTITNSTGTPILATVAFVVNGSTVGETTTTDPATGAYHVEVADEQYIITVTAPGYDPRREIVEIARTGEAPIELDYQLSGSSDVTGQIVNSQTGAGVSAATVVFLRQTGAGGAPATTPELSVQTDGAGQFQIADAPSGYFTMRVTKAGYVATERRDVQIQNGAFAI